MKYAKNQYIDRITENLERLTWHGKHVAKDLDLNKMTLKQLQAISFLVTMTELAEAKGGE